MSQQKKARGMTDKGFEELRFQIAYRAIQDYVVALKNLPRSYQRLTAIERNKELPTPKKAEKLHAARNYRDRLEGYLYGTGKEYGVLCYFGSEAWDADTDGMDAAQMLNGIRLLLWTENCPAAEFVKKKGITIDDIEKIPKLTGLYATRSPD